MSQSLEAEQAEPPCQCADNPFQKKKQKKNMLVRPSCGLWLRCRESGGGEVLSRLWCRLQYKPLRVFWPCSCLRRYISQDRVSDVHCPPRQFWKSFASTSRYQNSSESVLLCSRLCQGRPTELWNRQNLLCVFRTLHFCFYIVKVKKTPHTVLYVGAWP